MQIVAKQWLKCMVWAEMNVNMDGRLGMQESEMPHSKTMATDKETFQRFSQQTQHNQTQSLKMDQN